MNVRDDVYVVSQLTLRSHERGELGRRTLQEIWTSGVAEAVLAFLSPSFFC